jgi:Peroxidase
MRFCNSGRPISLSLAATAIIIMAASPKAVVGAFQLKNQHEHYSRRQPLSSIQTLPTTSTCTTTELAMSSTMLDRRNFGQAVTAASLSIFVSLSAPAPEAANAQVFFDPAQYGDQELRVGAVDSLRESVRRAILKKPDLAPSFFQLALLDALSYNAKTQQYGPDGSIIKVVLSSKNTDEYTTNLKECCLALIDAEKTLKRKTAITLADAIAIGGGEAIESIGGPVLPVQLGRADTPPQSSSISPDLSLDLFAGTHSTADIAKAFTRAGLTEREMTVLLCALLTLEIVEKSRSADGTFFFRACV